jgi:hypothetical protein
VISPQKIPYNGTQRTVVVLILISSTNLIGVENQVIFSKKKKSELGLYISSKSNIPIMYESRVPLETKKKYDLKLFLLKWKMESFELTMTSDSSSSVLLHR